MVARCVRIRAAMRANRRSVLLNIAAAHTIAWAAHRIHSLFIQFDLNTGDFLLRWAAVGARLALPPHRATCCLWPLSRLHTQQTHAHSSGGGVWRVGCGVVACDEQWWFVFNKMCNIRLFVRGGHTHTYLNTKTYTDSWTWLNCTELDRTSHTHTHSQQAANSRQKHASDSNLLSVIWRKNLTGNEWIHRRWWCSNSHNSRKILTN